MNKQAKIVLFTCLYILGIISFLSNNFLPIALVVLVALFCFRKLFSFKLLFVFISIFFVGYINSSCNLRTGDELVSFVNENVDLTAKVLTIPTNNIEDRTKFYAKILTVKTEDDKFFKVDAKTLITINDESENIKNIKIGDTLAATGQFKLPKSSQNPSQFDYAKYLQFKNTFTIMYLEKDWQIVDRASDFTGKILRKLNDTRNDIISIHAQNIKSPMLEILGGIIFGDDAVNPDEETKENFINSGIFHILAASGMNVTLIFGIWFFFASRLKFNYRFSICTGILLILFYTCMTGFGPPIIRATLMLTLILLGKLIDKEASTISLLFLVAFLMLIINPLMLYDIGFQMSFIVTFALILTAPLLKFEFKFKPLNYILGMCLIPIIAQLYAAPLQMYYFNTFTIYSVIANIVIIPVLSIVSFIGFISSIIALIQPIANGVCYFADLILNPFLIYIVKVAEFFSNLPFSIIFVKKPMLLQVLLYFSVIVSLTYVLREQIKSKKIYIAISCVFLIFLFSFMQIPNNKAEVMFFSVGNADAILIKSPKNDYFMIDTAKLGYKNSSTPARNIILKYMRDNAITNLHSLILTHFDADHAGGTIDILENLKVKNVYMTDVYENTMLSEDIRNYILKNKISHEQVKNTLTIYDKDNFEINIIKPLGAKILDENQKSLLVHIKHNDKNLLFMGDGDKESYKLLDKKYKQNISIMKSGHHGANNTLSDEMLDNTELFVISTGVNPYNHPHPDVIKSLEENNKNYLRTDRHNAIKIVLDKMPKVFIYSPKQKKFIKTVL